MKKVLAGDKLKIPAKTFNTFVDAGQYYLDRQGDLKVSPAGNNLRSAMVRVYNNSGADQDMFAVLAITGVSISQSDNENEFMHRGPVLTVDLWSNVTAADRYKTTFVILQQPVKQEKIARAKAFGVSQVQINVTNASHPYAKPSASSAILDSAWAGPTRILYQESGTGTKWAVVHFQEIPWINWEPTTPYEIDRSDSADDAKVWNPKNGVPANWDTLYDGVKLTWRTLRYDDSAGTLEYVDQIFQWLTPFAPVIEAVTPATADTGEC